MLKKCLGSCLAILLVLAMAVAPVSAAPPSGAAYGDDFEAYDAVEASDLQSLTSGSVLNENWQAYPGNMGYDGGAKAGIIDEISNKAGLKGKMLAIEGRAASNSPNQFPTVVYTGAYPGTDAYKITFTIITAFNNNHAGGGVRFAADDSFNNYYELFLSPSQYGQGAVYLYQNINGTRTQLYKVGEVDSTEVEMDSNGLTGWGFVCDVEVTLRDDEIDFFVESKNADENYWRMTKHIACTLHESPLKGGKIALFAAGQSGANVRFDDFAIEGVQSIPKNADQVYTDDFESYTTVAPDALESKGSDAVLSENWKTYPGYMGYDSNAKAGFSEAVAQSAAGGINNQGGLTGKVLGIEARAESDPTNAGSAFPTVVYTGPYPDSAGYRASFKMIANGGGGVRFAADDNFRNFYELYLRAEGSASSTVFLYKVQNGQRELLHQVSQGEFIMSNDVSGLPKWGNVFDVEISLYAGEITFFVTQTTQPNKNWRMTNPITCTDGDDPLAGGKVALFAAGQGGVYTGFDDFSIASYDLYTDGGAEPGSVLYQELTSGAAPSEEGVYALTREAAVRRVELVGAADGDKIEVSQDGENYFSIGSLSDREATLINTKSGAAFSYVKVPQGKTARIYTDVQGQTIELPLYFRTKFMLRFSGTDVQSPAVDGGSIAEWKENALYIKDGENTTGTVAFSSDGKGLSVRVTVLPAYVVTPNGDDLAVKVYVQDGVTPKTPVCFAVKKDGKGSLSRLAVVTEAVTYDPDSHAVTCTIEDYAAETDVTLMLWDGLGTMVPLANTYKL